MVLPVEAEPAPTPSDESEEEGSGVEVPLVLENPLPALPATPVKKLGWWGLYIKGLEEAAKVRREGEAAKA